MREGGLDATGVSARYLCLSASVKEVLPVGATASVAAAPDEKSLLSLL